MLHFMPSQCVAHLALSCSSLAHALATSGKFPLFRSLGVIDATL